MSLDKLFAAVAKADMRLVHVAMALDADGIRYAIAGGHAGAYWVSTIDEAATRVSPDVEVIVDLADVERIKLALQTHQFVYKPDGANRVFVDGHEGNARSGVKLVGESSSTAWFADAVQTPRFKVVDLFSFVRMNLVQNRNLNGMYLVDLMHVGLIGDSWLLFFDSPLRERLHAILYDDNEWFGFNTGSRSRAPAPAPRSRCG